MHVVSVRIDFRRWLLSTVPHPSHVGSVRRVYRVRSGVAVLYALDITVDIIVSHTFTVHSKKDIVPIKMTFVM